MNQSRNFGVIDKYTKKNHVDFIKFLIYEIDYKMQTSTL